MSVYIDGFNLYFGLRSKYPKLKWLDVHRLALNLLKPDQVLSTCNYFTARVRKNPNKQRRQTTYLDAIATTQTSLIYGKYYSKPVKCKRCSNTWPGNEEKMTDVNIAVKMLTDALQDTFDTAMVISGDSDLTPPIRAIKEFYPSKRVIVAFPPDRSSIELKKIADVSFTIGRAKLSSSQLPQDVITSNGYKLTKPIEWG